MNPIEDLCLSDPAFRGVTRDNVTDYFSFIVPHLLISEAKKTGAFEIDPIVSHFASHLGTLILDHLAVKPADSNRYNLICHYLMDQVYITRNPMIHQVVILDANMDSAAFRLPELADCCVFELQMNAVVLAEKERLIRKSGDKLLAKERHDMVGLFTKDGWQEVLLSHGFNPEEPTLWIMGSILSYMTVAGGVQLVSVIGSLSAPGSQIYADMFSGHKVKMTDSSQKRAVVDVHGPGFFTLHGDSAIVFQNLSKWTVELLARRDENYNYYGTMWDPAKLDKLRVMDGHLGPWFIVRFSMPAQSP